MNIIKILFCLWKVRNDDDETQLRQILKQFNSPIARNTEIQLDRLMTATEIITEFKRNETTVTYKF